MAAASDEVAVWVARVPSHSALSAADLALLDEEDLERCRRLRRGEERARFVAGRVLLRTALAAATGDDPRVFRFACTSSGQPRLASAASGLEFSLAHAGGAVAVAMARGFPVGVDIEPVVALEPGDIAVALSADERADLEGLAPAQRGSAVLRLWTLKEAWSKLAGRGVDLDFAGIEVAQLEKRPDLLLESFELAVGDGLFRVGLAARLDAGHPAVRIRLESGRGPGAVVVPVSV
jgi:4'-phosphopantetheinyl transferase